MSRWELWNMLKQPFAATLAAVLGATAAIIVSETGFVKIDPSSAAFITVLLIDSSSAENFYVSSTFRVLGTLIGIAVGAAVAFVSNALVAHDTTQIGIDAFQLSALGLALFVPLVIVKESPKHAAPCMIYVFTVTSLVFAGTSNAVTAATIAAVVGGIIIAAIVMYMFRYESAEAVLFGHHSQLIHSVLGMAKLSVRANPNFRADYFAILDSTKSSFSSNLESVLDYERWLRWTGNRTLPPYDFIKLTNSLRPLYHQTASLFWALCRDRVVQNEATDSLHLFCATSELYFDLYHLSVVGIVSCLDAAGLKLTSILKAPNPPSCSLLSELVDQDLSGYLKLLIDLQNTFHTNKNQTHPTEGQRWQFLEYFSQLSIVLTEFLDYILVFSEIVFPNSDHLITLGKQIRALSVFVEALGKEGYGTLGSSVVEYALPDDETESVADPSSP